MDCETPHAVWARLEVFFILLRPCAARGERRDARDRRNPRRAAADEFRLPFVRLTHFPKNHFAEKIKDENHAPRCTLSTLLHLSTSHAAYDQQARLSVLEIVQTLRR